MSDEQEQQPGTPPAEAQNTDKAEPMIPKSRFDEINTELKKLRADALARETERQQAAEKDAIAKGEFERLAKERGDRLAQLEPDHAGLTERYDSLVTLIEKQAQSRIRALPDEIKAMKPEGDVIALLDWLGKAEAAAAKLNTTRTPGTPPGPQGTGGDVRPPLPTDAVQAKRATIDYAI